MDMEQVPNMDDSGLKGLDSDALSSLKWATNKTSLAITPSFLSSVLASHLPTPGSASPRPWSLALIQVDLYSSSMASSSSL